MSIWRQQEKNVRNLLYNENDYVPSYMPGRQHPLSSKHDDFIKNKETGNIMNDPNNRKEFGGNKLVNVGYLLKPLDGNHTPAGIMQDWQPVLQKSRDQRLKKVIPSDLEFHPVQIKAPPP